MSATLRTARLVLRPYEAADAPAIAPLIGDWDVISMLSRPPHPYGPADAEEFVARVGGRAPPFALTLAATGELVGACGYESRGPDRLPELGYWIGKPFWGQGFGGEAATAVAAHAFETGAHAALLISCRIDNEASRRIIERLGARFLGLGEIASRPLGRDMPVRLYELTREEFAARLKGETAVAQRDSA